MNILSTFIISKLTVLIPFTWIVGLILKRSLTYAGSNAFIKWFGSKVVGSTKRIKHILYVLITALAVIFGLFLSTYSGVAKAFDVIVIYGLNGLCCVFIATVLYDKVREKR